MRSKAFNSFVCVVIKMADEGMSLKRLAGQQGSPRSQMGFLDRFSNEVAPSDAHRSTPCGATCTESRTPNPEPGSE